MPTKSDGGGEPQTPKLAVQPPPKEPAKPVGRLGAARAAVQDFLVNELDAREVRITKIVPHDHSDSGWSAEAEILVPNLEVKMLGLPLTQEVLEREHYTVELDNDLSVRSYEHTEDMPD
ncbi:hypothetical protein [Bradyrhizobium liaoningense]